MTRSRSEIEALAVIAMDMVDDIKEDIDELVEEIEALKKSMRIANERIRDLEMIRRPVSN